MKTEIIPELNEETGETVFAWFVLSASGETLAGGYCATQSEARSDAASCK